MGLLTYTGADKVLAEEIRQFKSGVDIIAHAAKLKTYRELLVLCYVDCLNREGLTKLEDLPQETKELIWQETKKESAGLNKKECIELSKVVYLISQKM